MSAFLYTVAGIVVGGLITFAVSRYYYRKAGEELRAESQKLRRLTSLVLTGLQEAGLIELSYDEDTGDIKGLLITDTFILRSPEPEKQPSERSPDEIVTVEDTLIIKPKPPEEQDPNHDPTKDEDDYAPADQDKGAQPRSWWRRMFGG